MLRSLGNVNRPSIQHVKRIFMLLSMLDARTV